MNEEQNSKDSAETQPKNPTTSAGQRLDQFISRAKRLSAATGQKAKEIAYAASPKLKEIRKAASETASHAVASQAARSPSVARARDFYTTGSNLRKAIMIYGGALVALLLISLVAMPFIWMASGGPNTNRSDSERAIPNASAPDPAPPSKAKSSPISDAQSAMLRLGNKYSPIDAQLVQAAVAQHRAGVPWSGVDNTMADASPAMQRAYREWKAACDENER